MDRVLSNVEVRRPLYAGDEVPKKFFNTARLLRTLKERDIDVLICHNRHNVYYLTGFNSRAAQSIGEAANISAVMLSRHEPDHPILIVPDWDLDYVENHPTWVEDVRAYMTLMAPDGSEPTDDTFARFVAPTVASTSWGANAKSRYRSDLIAACAEAFEDITGDQRPLSVAVDDPRFAEAVGLDGAQDAYGLMRFVRRVKTPAEIELLETSASINAAAITSAVSEWSPGMTWHELQHLYHVHAVALGGFVNDPGAINVANPPNGLGEFPMAGGKEDFIVERGVSMMWDCHGTWAHYCWDGGKTWVVGDERTGKAEAIEEAAQEAMLLVHSMLTPGRHTSEIQQAARRIFRKKNVPDADRALVFFHGLGLDHIELERTTAVGLEDWPVERNEIISTHVVYPGSAEDRYYLEDNAVVTEEGGQSLYDWGVKPFVGP